MSSSKASSLKPAKDRAGKDLIEAILTLRTPEEARRFLYDICTPKEVADLTDRWLVARLLDKGKLSYRDIHGLTGVSVTTIGRVARFLQQEPHRGYRLVIDRLNKARH